MIFIWDTLELAEVVSVLLQAENIPRKFSISTVNLRVPPDAKKVLARLMTGEVVVF